MTWFRETFEQLIFFLVYPIHTAFIGQQQLNLTLMVQTFLNGQSSISLWKSLYRRRCFIFARKRILKQGKEDVFCATKSMTATICTQINKVCRIIYMYSSFFLKERKVYKNISAPFITVILIIFLKFFFWLIGLESKGFRYE